MTSQARTRAEAAFSRLAKKEQQQTEAAAAWTDYQAKAAAVDANTARLRALRFARDANKSGLAETPKRTVNRRALFPAR